MKNEKNNGKQVITMAFNTIEKHNRLSEDEKLELAEQATSALGGITLTENIGGWINPAGKNEIEYSYTLLFFGVATDDVKAWATQLAMANGQEAYYLNDLMITVNN